MKLFFSIFLPLLLTLVLYQAFIIAPQANLKKALLNEYEDCKISNAAQNSINWLRQCDSIKATSKECKKILNDDYPWEWHHQYHAYTEGYESEQNKNGFSKYSEFNSKVSNCSCKTLPKKIADTVNNSLKENNENCLKELEIKSRVLL